MATSLLDSLPADLFDATTLVSLASTVAMLAVAYGASRAVVPSSTSAALRGLFVWHAFDAMIHFALEGSFLYHCFFSWLPLAQVRNPLALAPTAHNFLGRNDRAYGAQAAPVDNPFAQLWMVYAKADRRWAGADLVRVPPAGLPFLPLHSPPILARSFRNGEITGLTGPPLPSRSVPSLSLSSANHYLSPNSLSSASNS